MNTMYACKNAGRAGSTPVVGTITPFIFFLHKESHTSEAVLGKTEIICNFGVHFAV